jgi:hypothetical protein
MYVSFLQWKKPF